MSITIEFSGQVELDVADVWPDGDAPENPTAADVLAEMQAGAGSRTSLIDDWNLEDDLEITVSVHREGAPDSERTW